MIDPAHWYMQPQYSCVKVRVSNLRVRPMDSSATCVTDLARMQGGIYILPAGNSLN